MSFDEYGIGGDLEGGEGGGLAETNDQLSITEEVLISIANQLGGIGKGLEGFEGIAKKMGESKVVKSTSNMAKMFKNIAGASPQAFLIEKLFKTLKPLLDLFKPFQVILDLISALLKVLVGEALGPMFEALQPLYDMFISMMPIFAKLGGAIGNLIATLLEPLIDIFMALMPVIEPIIGIIISLINMAIEPLKAIFDALMPVIIPLIDTIVNLITAAIEPLMAIFDIIMPIIILLIDIALIPLKIIIGLLSAILEPMLPFIETFADLLKPIAAFLDPIITSISNFLGQFDLLDIAMKAIEFVIKGVVIVVKAVMTVFKNIGIFLKDIFKPILKFIGIALTAVGKGFEGFINLIINAINFVMNILTLGFWKDIRLLGQKKEEEETDYTGIFAGYVPREAIKEMAIQEAQWQGGGIQLAEGGFVSSGIYELGEGGQTEAVIPLTKWEKSVSAQNVLLGAIHDELMIANSHNRALVKAEDWKKVFG